MDSGGGRGKPPALNDSNNKAQGSDGRWMLKLIYPHATSLEVYLERWLRDIVTSAPSGGSISSAAIESFGNALSYLIREDDGPDFKLVWVCSFTEHLYIYIVGCGVMVFYA